jgi:hypothetical protein
MERWPELGGRELRYGGHTWALTGEVGLRRNGRTLGLRAERRDGSRRPTATLYFDTAGEDALNPGNLGEHFDSVVREEDRYALRVKTGSRTYRYELNRMEYE